MTEKRKIKEGQEYCPYKAFGKPMIIPRQILNMGLKIQSIILWGVMSFLAYKNSRLQQTIDELAGHTGMGPQVVARAVKELVEKRLIGREYIRKSKLQTNEYYFIWREDLNRPLHELNQNAPIKIDPSKEEPTVKNDSLDQSKSKDSNDQDRSMLYNKTYKDEDQTCEDKSSQNRLPRDARPPVPESFDDSRQRVDPDNSNPPDQSLLVPDTENENVVPGYAPVIELYYQCIGKKIPDPTTKTMAKIVNHLRRLIRGTLFNDVPEFENYHNRKFTLEDVTDAIAVHSQIMQPDFLPKDKKYLVGTTFADFLYNPYKIQKSYFLKWQTERPKRSEPLKRKDKYPAITQTFVKYFNRELSVRETNVLIEGAVRTHETFEKFGERINSNAPLRPEKKAQLVVWAIDSKYESSDIKIHPGFLRSDKTFNEVLPQYLEDKGWFKSTVETSFERNQRLNEMEDYVPPTPEENAENLKGLSIGYDGLMQFMKERDQERREERKRQEEQVDVKSRNGLPNK